MTIERRQIESRTETGMRVFCVSCFSLGDEATVEPTMLESVDVTPAAKRLAELTATGHDRAFPKHLITIFEFQEPFAGILAHGDEGVFGES